MACSISSVGGGTGLIFLKDVTYQNSQQKATITANEWEEWGKKYKFLLFYATDYWQSMCYAPPLCNWGKSQAGTAQNSNYYIDHSNAMVSHDYAYPNVFIFSVGSSTSGNFKIYGIPF